MRIFLLPLSLLYQLVLFIRHKFFDWGLIKSTSFEVPVICVGNLSMGGTGKTPHIEYLVRLLAAQHKIGILSRGYGRKTRGFLQADTGMTYKHIGDEPMQYVRKFDKVQVAVCEKRVEGVKKMIQALPGTEIFLLDDAFQHRYIKAGLNILLTDYHNLYPKDFLFPAGNLRDLASSAKRADIIVVTKTPKVFSPFTRRRLTEIIKPEPSQRLYFSYLQYGRFTPVSNQSGIFIPRNIGTILLFCGIANPYPFQEFLRSRCNDLITIDFPDHHAFTKKDLYRVVNEYENILGKNKIVVTTEKDAMRLIDSPYFRLFENIPFFYVPVEVRFHDEERITFDQQLIEYVRKNSANSSLHSVEN